MTEPVDPPDHANPHKLYFRKSLPLSGKTIYNCIHVGRAHHDAEDKARKGAKRKLNRRARRAENSITRDLANDHDD